MALRRFWRVLVPVALLGFTAMVLSGWLAVHAYQARSHLNTARQDLLTVESALRQGRVTPNDTAVQRAVAAATASTEAARRLTSDRLWRLAARVPVAGCPLRSSAGLTLAAAQVSREVVRPLAALAPAMAPHRHPGGFAVDVRALRRASADVERIAQRLDAIRADVRQIRSCSVLGSGLGLASAREEFLTRTGQVAVATNSAKLATRLLPPLLGADQPRRYLLIVQNAGESRATGGIIGGHGVLTAAAGRLSLDMPNNGALPGFPVPAVRLSGDVAARYERLGLAAAWSNPNLTPDYPLAARVFAAMWHGGGGPALDGVVTIDTTLLSYLLSVVGMARMPDGQLATATNLVPLLQSRVYAMFSDNPQRDAYFAAAGMAIYRALTSSRTPPLALLPVLGRGAAEGRLLVWSRRPAEQRLLEKTALAGVLPSGDGPFLAVVTQNGTGSKLDYWLRRSTTYHLRRLRNGSAEATVTVQLTNTAPARGLPLYVRQRFDRDALDRQLPGGQTAVYVSLYGGVGSGFVAATLDGVPLRLESEVEKGHGVFSTTVTLNSKQTSTLRVVLMEPKWQQRVTFRPQPLLHPEPLTITGVEKRSVVDGSSG